VPLSQNPKLHQSQLQNPLLSPHLLGQSLKRLRQLNQKPSPSLHQQSLSQLHQLIQHPILNLNGSRWQKRQLCKFLLQSRWRQNP
jgi:hypothetical protein